MDELNRARRRPILWSLFWFLGLPAAVGLLCGYGLHWYQASQIREDFAPYRATQAPAKNVQSTARAYIYIQDETTVEFGEIDNYKRYRKEWDLVNTGIKTLDIQLVSHSCEVEFNGKPMQTKEAIAGRSMVTLAMTWVVQDNGPDFQQELVLKTNDDDRSRRDLNFRIHGTVNPAIEFLPPSLDFGELSTGQTKELAARVLCYRTKNFKIEDFSLTNESLRTGFEVRLEPIEDVQGLRGDRHPESAVSVIVTAKADALEQKRYAESLLLRSNMAQIEGLQLGLTVTRK